MTRGIHDTNVYLSRWPLRRLPSDRTPSLVSKLRRCGVARAWAGSFDGLLHRDVAGVNDRLARACRKHGDRFLIPFGTVNPALPDWQEDLRRCRELHHMPGIRLHPNYHGYTLDDPRFLQLLRMADQARLIVQIVVTMEDERMQHPLLRVPHVDTTPLPDALRDVPGLRVVLLNAFRSLRPHQVRPLVEAGRVHVDIAMLEGIDGVGKLLHDVPLQRILFGSHSPLFYVESALFKLREAALGGAAIQTICRENPAGLLSDEVPIRR